MSQYEGIHLCSRVSTWRLVRHRGMFIGKACSIPVLRGSLFQGGSVSEELILLKPITWILLPTYHLCVESCQRCASGMCSRDSPERRGVSIGGRSRSQPVTSRTTRSFTNLGQPSTSLTLINHQPSTVQLPEALGSMLELAWLMVDS